MKKNIRFTLSGGVLSSLVLMACSSSVNNQIQSSKESTEEEALGLGVGLEIRGSELVYAPDKDGNVMPDFSYVGYREGMEAIPDVAVRATVEPGNGDDGARIQAAIDQVSALPLENGFRGAVLLKKGTYEVAEKLSIRASGVVLRGEGRNEAGTVIIATGKKKRNLIEVMGSGDRVMVPNSRIAITSPYIPFGHRVLEVASIEPFKVGDSVVVQWKNNEKWIAAIGMNKISGGSPWSTFTVHFERKIKSICGNSIVIDAPLVQSIDQKYSESYLYKYTFDTRISNVGIERLRLVSEYVKGEETSDEDHAQSAVVIDKAEHGWVRDISAHHFVYATVWAMKDARNFTVTDSHSVDPVSEIDGRRRYSFKIEGSFHLFQNNTAKKGRHDFVTGGRVAGPNVFFNSKATNTYSDTGPHMKWAMGTLYDNITADEINVQDRGDMGTQGHGWAGAQQVFWNNRGGSMICEKPPLAQNFSFGFVGNKKSGYLNRKSCAWTSQGKRMSIDSLYRKQLEDRRNSGERRYVLNASCKDPRFVSLPVTGQTEKVIQTKTVRGTETGKGQKSKMQKGNEQDKKRKKDDDKKKKKKKKDER